MLNETERGQLLRLAAEAIHCGLRTGQPLRVDTDPLSVELLRVAASFVSLHRQQQLRGCIGSLAACQPLALNVADNAFNAAFRDPRFAPLQAGELGDLELEISVLGVPEELCCGEEAELLAQLRPGEHGLILEAGGHRGTFLPSVWESLPEPVDFLCQLKRKAGLPGDFWSADIRVQCYETEAFGAAFSAVERSA